MKRVLQGLAVSVAAAVLLSACSSGATKDPTAQQPGGAKYMIDDQDVTALYAAAKKEGKLMYYGGAYPTDQTQAYGEEFKKAFPGIEIEVYRGTTPAVLERFLSEARGGKFLADVLFQGDPYTLKSLIKDGHLLEYNLGSVAKYPPNMITDKYVYPHSVVYIGPIYNTNLVKGDDEKKLQTDWKFVTDPKWKGKLALTVPEAGGTSYGPIYMFLGEMRDKFGPDFIKALQPNVGQAFTSTVPATAQVAAGEFAIHVHGQTPAAGGQIAQGAPIRIAFPAPTPAVPVGAAIAAKAPHPNAAKLFMEWAFSKQGQEKIVEIGTSHVLRTDVTADPFAKYDWYKKPTEIWVAKDLDAYMKGLKGIADEWHGIMGTKK
jgi:iron(III) transport system substrate-binding protein